eukprot:COSAG01_NODE_1282_length_10921_cov_8.334319_4_plen_317_part_00
MGLGKTLMTLYAIAGDHQQRSVQFQAGAVDCAPVPSLVVCPSSLVSHWHDEAMKHCGKQFRALQYIGPPRKRQTLRAMFRTMDLVIMSYETARVDAGHLEECHFNYGVLDEGHTIRNSRSQTSQAVKRLKCNHRLILSGTPIQNNLKELWSLFDFLMPDFLGSQKIFNERFKGPAIDASLAKSDVSKTTHDTTAMEALHRQVLPFILCRQKSDVLQELPPKIVQDLLCDMSSLQVRLYEQAEQDQATIECIRTVSKGGKPSRQSMASLHYMRKISNHPALALGPGHPLYTGITNDLRNSGSSLHDLRHAPKLLALR